MINCYLCYYPLSSSESYYCYECLQALPFITSHCRSCALPTAITLDICGNCQKRPYTFDQAFSLFDYKPPIQAFILAFKANRVANLNPLQHWLFSAFYHQFINRNIDAIIPIPSTLRSRIKRGHAPANTLARLLCEKTQIPVVSHSLTKKWLASNQKTKTQTSRKQTDQFQLSLGKSIPSKQVNNILLIDDVMTTGSSANEAAKKLKDAGIKQVDVLTIARTPMKH